MKNPLQGPSATPDVPEAIVAPYTGEEEMPDLQDPNETGASETGVEGADAVLETEVQKHIGRCLKEAYDELVTQPVPDRFVQLLKELEAKSGSTKSEK